MPSDAQPVSIDEAIEAVNAATGGDKAKVRDFVKKLRSDAPDVANYLITSGKNQRETEVAPQLKTLETRIAELEGDIETRDAELTALRQKAPEAAAVEEATKRKYEGKLRKMEAERDEAFKRYNDALVQVAIDKAVALLITPNEQGVRVDKEYAELIASQRLRPQIVPKPDGGLTVKQIGEESEYDGDTLDAKIGHLVKDFRPYIPNTFQLSNADSGAGVRNGSSSGPAPGLKTQQQIIEAKRSNPAFAGL